MTRALVGVEVGRKPRHVGGGEAESSAVGSGAPGSSQSRTTPKQYTDVNDVYDVTGSRTSRGPPSFDFER